MDCVVGKLFVGGLKKETSEETLEQHFSKYGQLKDCIIMKNWYGDVGRSRGFGFVTFVEPFHAHHALLDCINPIIDGKMVEVKPAIPRDAYTRVNVYNTYNTGLDLGFGTSVTMNGFSSSSGAYVYPYNGGMCYYYCPCPFMVPQANYNFVAPCFCGVNMYMGWNCNYYPPGFHINDGGVLHYYENSINGGVDNSIGSEERAVDHNYVCEQRDDDTLRNRERVDETLGNKEQDDCAVNVERANIVNKEGANHGDPKPKDSGGNVSCPLPGITMSVGSINENEALITKSNGLILLEQYSD